MRLLLPCLGLVIGSAAVAGELKNRPTPLPAALRATPLRMETTAPMFQSGTFAWTGQALCDDNENAYFVVLPPYTPKSPNGPRDVLRVSADGKKRVTYSPAAVSKFASADELTTITIALDEDGGLFMLVWARWGERGPSEKSGQYIVSFDKKGEYRSHFEFDGSAFLIEQFEVFGSGQFLVRGRRPDRPEARLAVLSAAGTELKNVIGWPGLYKTVEEPSPGGVFKFDQVARAGDGRIYIAQPDARQGEDVVYVFTPSGDSDEVFMLRRLPRAPQLVGWKASGDRFAAAYLKPGQQAAGSPGDSYLIAVYNNPTGGGDLEPIVYGPAPGPPICYRHEDSGDRFTFLQAGKLVTMSAP